jgi:5-oxoprolinase (ATP-hydrolysing)
LLERQGTPPVLFITRGFGDLLAIGNQQRPDLFALEIVKPEPLCAVVIEVDERLRADGSVEKALDLGAVEAEARRVLEAGHAVAAIAFLHSYRNPEHEEQLAERLLEMGFLHASTSSGLSSRLKILPRAQTTVVDAYLAPVVGKYLEKIDRGLEALSLHVMTSAGGLVRHDGYRAKDSLLSGPAGGVVGAVAAAQYSGEERILAFDMGGTSTDVTRYDGQLEYRWETIVGDAHLVSPSLAVETVAAGGGSVCRFDGHQLKVGPQSAGASPGPACYGNGGPFTLTDVNLLLGRLLEPHFPFRVDRAAAAARSLELQNEHRRCRGAELGAEELLFGFLQIANEKMAGAVRAISLRTGYDPGDYALLTFGGAGPQHACALADILEIDRVLVPRDAALLSAFGLGQAGIERFAERQVLECLEEVEERLHHWFLELEAEASSQLEKEGIQGRKLRIERQELFLRLSGQEATLKVRWEPRVDVAKEFAAAYEDHFGYRPPERDLEVESLRLMMSANTSGTEEVSLLPSGSAPGPSRRQQVFTSRGWMEGVVVERQHLALDSSLAGPGLVVEQHTVTVIEPGWRARLDSAGALILEKV